MRSEWVERTLGELSDNFDAIRVPIRDADRRAGPYPYYGASGVVDYVDSYLFDGEYLLIAEDGENLRTRKTPVAFLARGRFWVNNHAHIVRGNSNADTRFLMYALSIADISGYLTGSTMPKLTQGNLNRIPILVPPLADQRAIARILGALDDKIELNRRMSETLEEMARALFKSWFVEFDPVRANAEGHSLGLPQSMSNVFPTGFVESELGMIPERWEVAKLSSVGRIVCGKTPPTQITENYGDDVPFITIPDMHGRIFATTTKRRLSELGAASQKNKTLPAGAICVSCIATPGLVVITSEPAQTNQQINALIPDRSGETYFWFWALRDLGHMIRAGGSGGSVLTNLSTGRFADLNILSPPSEIRALYHRSVEPIFGRVLANEREVQTLAAVRDALLPKLISGELRVKEGERFVEKAVA